MKFHGIDVVGKFITQRVDSLPAWAASDEGRILYVTPSGEMYFGGDSGWIEIPRDPINAWYTISGDSGSTDPNTQQDTLSLTGAGTVSTSVSGDVVTISGSSPDAFTTVDGDVGTSIQPDDQSDTLTFAGSTNITTSGDATSDTLTIIGVNIWNQINADTGSTTPDTALDTLTISGGDNCITSIAGDILTIDVDDLWWTIGADSGSTTPNAAHDTLTFAGAGTITTSVSGDIVTISGTEGAAQNVFTTVAGDVGTSAVADSSTDTLTIAGGTNITTSGNSTSDTLTINGVNIWNQIDGDTGSTTPDTALDTLVFTGAGTVTTSVSGDTVTISGAATGAFKETIASGSWTPSGTDYYYDVVHNLNLDTFDDFILQVSTTADNKVFHPDDIIGVDADTIRLWVATAGSVRVRVIKI
jgi:hypothetical protein